MSREQCRDRVVLIEAGAPLDESQGHGSGFNTAGIEAGIEPGVADHCKIPPVISAACRPDREAQGFAVIQYSYNMSEGAILQLSVCDFSLQVRADGWCQYTE